MYVHIVNDGEDHLYLVLVVVVSPASGCRRPMFFLVCSHPIVWNLKSKDVSETQRCHRT